MTTLNQDILQGQWRALRGRIQQRWGDLTDSDLDKVQGRVDEFAGLLQKKYGYGKKQARQEIENVVDSFEQNKEEWAEQMPEVQVPQISAEQRSPWMFVVAFLFLGVAIALIMRRDA